MSVTTLLLAAHVALGTVAVAAGLAALVTAKGDRAHRRSGRWFLRSMLVVLASAWTLTIVQLDPYFAGLSASATLGTFSGWRVLRRKRPDVDPRQRATALDWAVTLAALLVALLLAALAHGGVLRRNLPVVLALAYGTLAYAVWDVWRFLRPRAWPFGPRLWLYEHIVKITGAYFGAVAAFSGSVLVLLDPPWRQLWAVLLGQAVAIAFVVQQRGAARAARVATDDRRNEKT